MLPESINGPRYALQFEVHYCVLASSPTTAEQQEMLVRSKSPTKFMLRKLKEGGQSL
jgi:hypothetical protein